MDAWVWVLLVAIAAVVVIGGIAGWWIPRRRRSDRLRQEFGSEYERMAEAQGRAEAEAELRRRQRRVEALDIRPLFPAEARRFQDMWQSTQGRFVDSPGDSVMEADRLVEDVMRTRGYPVGDFERRAADISVGHPEVVSNYRTAHAVAARQGRLEATTEELRQAMVHYRLLFADLLEVGSDEGAPRGREEAPREMRQQR